MTHRGLFEALQANMDGRGRALDSGFCERKWRSVRHKMIYLMRYGTVRQLRDGLICDFDFYNHERAHQGHNYCTLAAEHFAH